MKRYETVIGLEVHVELATRTKIFCGCSTEFGAGPNTHACPVCAGMPGALPVLNKKAVEFAAAAGLALHCQISRVSRFDRKNYFYPDNPQNYQISQLYLPLCRDGFIEIGTGTGKKRIRIHEIHMEEDAGKLIHDEQEGCSLVDYNRSGVPLIEIVTEPDMRSAEEAAACLEKLRQTLRYLGVSDCRMEEGSMRADVNLSVREAGSTGFGVRTEMKNLNSFRAVSRAVEGESARQTALLEDGKEVTQETRRWDDNRGISYSMRSKEDARDYRYFPEPDLPPLYLSEEWTGEIRKRLPETREEKMARCQREYGLSAYDAGLLTESRRFAELYEETAKLSGNYKKTANWFTGEGLRLLKENARRPEQIQGSPERLAVLMRSVEKGEISQTNAKLVFEQVFLRNVEPEAYMEEHGLKITEDARILKQAVREAVGENPGPFAELKGGKEKVYGFFVGKVMQKMKGKAEPARVRELLEEAVRDSREG